MSKKRFVVLAGAILMAGCDVEKEPSDPASSCREADSVNGSVASGYNLNTGDFACEDDPIFNLETR